MKSALKLILFILLLTYGLDKLVYLGLNTVSDKVMSGQSIGKLNQYLSQKDAVDLVAFGSSRANHHIDVKKLNPSSFNMGIDGSSMAYASTLIQLLPKDKAQVVLLNIDPNRLYLDDYNGSDIKGLITKYNRNKTIKTAIDKFDQNNSLQSFLWSLDYNGKVIGIVKNAIAPKYDHKSYYGFDPLSVSETQKEQFKLSLQQTTTYQCDENKEIHPLVWKCLNDIKTFCEANNKTLIMLTTPTFKPVCKIQYDNLANKLKDINVTYKDYSEFFLEENNFDYWKDKTHLSAEGATIFSDYLSKDLRNNKLIH